MRSTDVDRRAGNARAPTDLPVTHLQVPLRWRSIVGEPSVARPSWEFKERCTPPCPTAVSELNRVERGTLANGVPHSHHEAITSETGGTRRLQLNTMNRTGRSNRDCGTPPALRGIRGTQQPPNARATHRPSGERKNPLYKLHDTYNEHLTIMTLSPHSLGPCGPELPPLPSYTSWYCGQYHLKNEVNCLISKV